MKNRTSREIKKIAVIGAGTMGPGIIQAFACGGYDVHVWEPVESNREKARARIRAGLELAASGRCRRTVHYGSDRRKCSSKRKFLSRAACLR